MEPAHAGDTADFIRIRGLTRENAITQARLAGLGITADSWAAQMRSGELQGWVARRQGRIVGYGFGDIGTGEVVVLALLPEAEGLGVGKRLLEAVVRCLREAGHTRLFLGCSTDPAVRSHGFYRHLGWRSTGTLDAHGDERLELGVCV